MDRPRSKHLDFIQNIIIVLLTLSAVALFIKTQSDFLDSDGYLSHLIKTPDVPASPSPTDLADLAAPVRIAVTGAYGRYGNVSLTTTDEAFTPLSTLLGEVLGSAKNFSVCDKTLFQTALSGNSVYYDFLSSLPLPILSGFAGGETNSAAHARSLVVFQEGEQIILCLWDGMQTYLRGETAVSAEDFEKTVNSYELSNAFFAFESAETSDHYAVIAPHSLFPADLPTLPTLSAVSSLAETSNLLVSLGFNPYTNSRYTESSGTEVIMEGDRSLHIQPNGALFYQGSDSSVLNIEAVSSQPTMQEAVVGSLSLLHSLLENVPSDATLYLQSIQQEGSRMILRFSYQLDGVPIRLSSGVPAAEVILSGSNVLSFQLHCRQYTRAATPSHLLPLRQALALASDYDGAEVFISYIDYGSSTVSAEWLAE